MTIAANPVHAHRPAVQMRILLVEDERKTASFLQTALEAEGFAVSTMENGLGVLARLQESHHDLVILDIMLPRLDGLGVLRSIRKQGLKIPILLISARGAMLERVQGLDAGADDFLAKPFALPELLARVRALRRRVEEIPSTKLQLADLTLDTVTHRAERNGEVIELAPREYRLLEYLFRSRGNVCARMSIVENVWDYDFDPGTNLVDVYIRRLREKIDAGHETKLLHTVRGLGYVLKHPEP